MGRKVSHSYLWDRYTRMLTSLQTSAYLLATAALSPLYGRISDIVGRKAVLYPIVVLFLVSGQSPICMPIYRISDWLCFVWSCPKHDMAYNR